MERLEVEKFWNIVDSGVRLIVLFIPLSSLSKEYLLLRGSWLTTAILSRDFARFTEMILTAKNSIELPFSQNIEFPMFGTFENTHLQKLEYNLSL